MEVMDELTTAPHRAHTIRGHTIQDTIRILIKRRWAFLTVFVIVAGTVAFRTLTATPIYQATVQILIERQAPRILETPGAPSEYYSEEFYQTQYKLLESRALAKKVVDKLHLKDHRYYAEIFKSLPPDADALQKQRAEEGLVDSIAGGVSVAPIRQSSLVNVSFSHPDPQFATDLINALGQCYIEQSLDLRFAASQEAAVWLREKLAEARKKLEESEAKLNQYKREQNIVSFEDKESITGQKLEQLNKDLTAAQTHRMEVETRYKEVSQGRPIAQVLNNPLIQSLKVQEAKLVAEQSELSRKFGESHPRMIQLANELSATRGKINLEMSQVVQTIKNEYSMAKAQEENLKAALNVSKEATQDLGDRSIQYRVLLRDVETSRALYENVLKSLKTTTTTENVPSTNIRIVYPATVPGGPVSPRTGRELFVGVFMGLTLGLVLVFGLESLDTTLKTPEDLERWLEVPNLAMIPHVGAASRSRGASNDSGGLFVHDQADPIVSEAYRVLRTSILFSAPGQTPRVLLVTSSLPSEGKTITAANLATVMAKAEPKVLLVDSDLRRPTLHKLFAVPKEPGLTNFLVGETDSIPFMETMIPHLFLVPAGPIPPNPSELLGSDRMDEFLRLTQEQFGRVILDSPPLISVTDAAVLSTHVAGVILVVKAEAVPRKMAVEARGQLHDLKATLLGTVLNNIPTHRDGYYYNYYYYRYRSYYTQDGAPARGRARRKQPSSPYYAPIAWLKNRLDDFRKRIH